MAWHYKVWRSLWYLSFVLSMGRPLAWGMGTLLRMEIIIDFMCLDTPRNALFVNPIGIFCSSVQHCMVRSGRHGALYGNQPST